MSIFLVQEFHEIVPPVDYSLVPTWMIFLGTFLALSVIGAIVWLVFRSRKKEVPAKSPRERAFLVFEGVAYAAKVALNGVRWERRALGRHLNSR